MEPPLVGLSVTWPVHQPYLSSLPSQASLLPWGCRGMGGARQRQAQRNGYRLPEDPSLAEPVSEWGFWLPGQEAGRELADCQDLLLRFHWERPSAESMPFPLCTWHSPKATWPSLSLAEVAAAGRGLEDTDSLGHCCGHSGDFLGSILSRRYLFPA